MTTTTEGAASIDDSLPIAPLTYDEHVKAIAKALALGTACDDLPWLEQSEIQLMAAWLASERIGQVQDRTSILTVDGLIALSDRIRSLAADCRAKATANPTRGLWGAVEFLESASRSIHGAAGWLYQDEKETRQ